MTPADLVQALLQARDAAARQALLLPRDQEFYLAVVNLLKEEADRERLRDPRAALRIAGMAAEVAALTDAPRCRAVAAWARGNVLIHQGEYEECLRLYEKAAHFFAAEGAEVEAARLMVNRAWVLKNLGRYDEGVQAADGALTVLRRHPPSRFLASALNALGTLHRLSGRHREALTAFDEGERLYADLGDKVNQARLRINKANVLRNLDRFREARDLLQSSRATLARHGRSLETARADLNLGIVYTRLGRYDEALAALDRAAAGFDALGNDMETAVVELHRADLYAAFNLYDDLLQTAVRDWRFFEERQMQRHAARALLHKAVAWRRLGDPARAEALLDEVQAAFARLGDPLWVRLIDLERAALECELGAWASALTLAVRTAAFFREREMPLRAAGGSLLAAECRLALGRPDEAAASWRAVLDLACSLDAPFLLYRAHHGLGRAAAQQGRQEEALAHLRRAVEAVEEMRQRLRVEDFRLGFLEDKLDVYHDAALLCLQLGREEEALAYVERAKSGALVDLLIAVLERCPVDRDGTDGDLAARLGSLRRQLDRQYTRLEGDDGAERGPGWEPLEKVRRQIARTERKAVRAWREFQRANPFYPEYRNRQDAKGAKERRLGGLGASAVQQNAGAGASSAPQDDIFALDGKQSDHDAYFLGGPPAVQADLGEGERLLRYWLAGERVHVFVVGPEGLEACVPLRCTPRQVAEAASALDAALRGALSVDKDYVADSLLPLSRRLLGWLYDDLLRPIAPLLRGTRRLLIAPDDRLLEIPFHALYDGAGYLLDRYEIAYTPGVGALGLCRENRRRGGDGGQALIVGNTEGDLAHIRPEVEAVADALPEATVLLDDEARPDRLRDLVGQSKLLHLATHALFRRDNPLFSALRLGGGEWLRVMDLYTLPLNGPLVTLSGCETGRHRLLGGDLLGLSRGFFCAGASALVVSLWPVDDVSTALLMARFYAHLAAGETAAAALRRAQQGMRDLAGEGGREEPPYAHPFHWAPFCLLGAPEVRLEKPG